MQLQPDELEFAFSPDPIVGWRIWRVERGIDRKLSAFDLAAELREVEREGATLPVENLFRYRLRSLTQQALWPPGIRMEAACNAGEQAEPHRPGPEPGCECGIWAYRSRRFAEETLLDYMYCGRALALGRIALWGRLIEQERGWRAQYGYPLAIEVYGGAAEVAEDLRLSYRVKAEPAYWPVSGGSRAA